eukprot:sb/3477223/
MSDLSLDPQLMKGCMNELKTTCSLDTMEDQSEVMECLRTNELTLSSTCRSVINIQLSLTLLLHFIIMIITYTTLCQIVFDRELQQAEDPGLDANLLTRCRNAISLYCSNR